MQPIRGNNTHDRVSNCQINKTAGLGTRLVPHIFVSLSMSQGHVVN